MARKTKDENEENIQVTEAEQPEADSSASETDSGTESSQAASGGETDNSIVGSAVEAVSSAVETVIAGVSGVAGAVANVVTGEGNGADADVKRGNRAQKIGIVTSDKMTKTVVVRVDRQIMHPKYRRYVRRRTKFMAHDEKGAGIGDKVRIVETRPLSARKRWRVVEIIQKAAR